MELLIILLIPLVAAVLSLIHTKKGKFAAAMTIIAAFSVFILSLHIAIYPHSGMAQNTPGIKGWLSCNPLSALILLLISFVGLTASIFSFGYIGDAAKKVGSGGVRRYYARYNLFLLSMLAVPMLSQLAMVWIAVELTTLFSVFLVSFEETAESLEAAWKYVILTCMGAAFALIGILILYRGLTIAGGSAFTWSELIAVSPNIPPLFLAVAFLFILIGFGTKAGLVPLHTWLPDAHSQAPSPVCALLSGVETTTALYVIIRLLPVIKVIPNDYASMWLMIFGLVSVGTAAFLLLQVTDYKRLFAFSTIEHMGIILVAAGLGGQAAHLGVVYQIMAHAFTKSFCFFAAGAVLLLSGTRDISSVKGMIRTSPLAGVCLLIGGLAIAGAPPFAVFLSEFSIISAGLAGGHYLVIALLALFIVIAFCGIMYRVNKMVFGRPSGCCPQGLSLPFTCRLTLLLAIVPVILFGLYIPGHLHNLLRLAALSLGR
ncbi:MAG: hydrogenase 4 subunit F [Deltaproteobacteria bacterium]|nr:hydrogenase 4 subunit F [Deltaproteobacteria bacterium]